MDLKRRRPLLPPTWVRKCVELHEQLKQRMGVVVVGPSGSGKSSLIKLLRNALGKMGVVVRQHTINAKALSHTQLLGSIDLDTRQWVDGVLSTTAQAVYSQPTGMDTQPLSSIDLDTRQWVDGILNTTVQAVYSQPTGMDTQLLADGVLSTTAQAVYSQPTGMDTQLLGSTVLDTRQWVDGVLSTTAQAVYSQPTDMDTQPLSSIDLDTRQWVDGILNTTVQAVYSQPTGMDTQLLVSTVLDTRQWVYGVLSTTAQAVYSQPTGMDTQLLGSIDLDIRQWADGVLSTTAQAVYSQPTGMDTQLLGSTVLDTRQWVDGVLSTTCQAVYSQPTGMDTQLLGSIDLDTRQWVDGVLSTTAQAVYSQPTGTDTQLLGSTVLDTRQWVDGVLSTTCQAVYSQPTGMDTQLLGSIDLDTRQWVDGVLSTTGQAVYSQPTGMDTQLLGSIDLDTRQWVNGVLSTTGLTDYSQPTDLDTRQWVDGVLSTTAQAVYSQPTGMDTQLLGSIDLDIRQWVDGVLSTTALTDYSQPTDLDTRQWVDGVLSTTAQAVYSQPTDVECWIVFDSDVDPEWVESLNSVLDDNRLLTLPSGWRIQFGPNVHFLFETHDLSHASPATVSRMGMILLSCDDVDWKDLVEAWLLSQSPDIVGILSQYIDEYFYQGVDWVLEQGQMVVPSSPVALVKSGLSHMAGVVTRAQFTVSLVNGLATNLTDSSRQLFCKQVLEWTGEFMAASPSADWMQYDARRDCVDVFTDQGLVEGQGLVLTAQLCFAANVLSSWLLTHRPFILIGPHGCGKSLLLDHCFSKLRSVEVATVHCSAQISPHHILQKLSQLCMVVTSSSGRVYRPARTEHLILHLKNVNLVTRDKWGSNMLMAWLQQVLTYGGFYDTDLEWAGLEGVQFVFSLSSSEAISPRFLALNLVYSLSCPGQAELKTIYREMTRSILPTSKNTKMASTLANTMVNIYLEPWNCVFSKPRSMQEQAITLKDEVVTYAHRLNFLKKKPSYIGTTFWIFLPAHVDQLDIKILPLRTYELPDGPPIPFSAGVHEVEGGM
ncbi:Cytoplasmic dynein 2 heavy chain 1 [Homalodisca vitripennis]|nr:Cytoplasmic dynein 2 heavy chain 1 [Homalodisca vitripennis]